jgi:hypothetical protein
MKTAVRYGSLLALVIAYYAVTESARTATRCSWLYGLSLETLGFGGIALLTAYWFLPVWRDNEGEGGEGIWRISRRFANITIGFLFFARH